MSRNLFDGKGREGHCRQRIDFSGTPEPYGQVPEAICCSKKSEVCLEKTHGL